MGAFIVIVLIFIALMKLPRVTTAAVFTMFAFSVVEEGTFLQALPGLLVVSVIMTCALQLSTQVGSLRLIVSHIKASKKKVIGQILITFGLIFVGFIVVILISLFFRYVVMPHAEYVGFFLILALSPVAGFAIASCVKAVADELWGSDEEIDAMRYKRQREQKEREQEEAQRQWEERIIAESNRRMAEINAAHERELAIEKAKKEAEKARIKAEQEKQAAAEKAKKKRLSEIKENNEKAVDDFWALVTSEYGLDPAILQGLSTANSLDLDSEVTTEEEVWVSNDKRIEAIENIIKSSGFSADGLQPPRFPYESALLEYAFSVDSPIFECVDEFHWGSEACEVNGRVLPFEYIRRYSVGAEKVLGKLCRYYKRCLDTYQSDYGIIKSGLKGEYAVQSVLDMHAGAFIVVHDLRLEFPGKNGEVDSVETDTVVLAPNGIFAVEVKNYGSSGRYKIVVTGDGNWYKEYPPLRDGKVQKREVMKNPFAQNDRHIAYLERFINELLGRDMANWARVENIICLANDEVAIENDPDAKQTLTRVSNLYNQLTYDRTQKFTVEELEKIKAAFDEKGLPGKKYPLPDYSKQMKWAVDWYRYISQSLHSLADGIYRCAPEHLEFFDRILYK